MEGISGEALIAFGAIIAAIIAGFFSYLSLVISKEQKISEFRQQWIDSLRKEISQYISSIDYLVRLDKILSKSFEDDSYREKYMKLGQKAFDLASQAYTSIILRVNPDEKDPIMREHNNEFLSALKTMRDATLENLPIDLKRKIDDLREILKPVLKHEWNRVKQGEPTYRMMKKIAFITLFLGLAVSAVAVIITVN